MKVVFEVETNNISAINHTFGVFMDDIVHKRLRVDNWKIWVNND